MTEPQQVADAHPGRLLAGRERAPTGAWRRATVRQVSHRAPRAVALRLDVPDRIEHLPGQHYVVRLTAPDGYVAQRSYSIASPPSEPLVELFVARLEDGEVSGYLGDVTQVGDELDVRGPIGGWFVWPGDTPAVGIAGGSGVVPLVAMVRHASVLGRSNLLRVAVASRTLLDLPYADVLEVHGALIALTREDSAAGRPRGRLTAADMTSLFGSSSCLPSTNRSPKATSSRCAIRPACSRPCGRHGRQCSPPRGNAGLTTWRCLRTNWPPYPSRYCWYTAVTTGSCLSSRPPCHCWRSFRMCGCTPLAPADTGR